MGAAVAALVIAVTVRFGTFAPWGTDQAGYIEAGHRWANGHLMTPAPLHFWARWNDAGLMASPLGLRPGAIRGTEVSSYPLGYPLFIAAAVRVGGDLAPYVVAPLFAGLLAWCAYVLATRLAGPWAGAIAATLVAASPITLVHAVMPMSDVPAAALWALAWVMSLRVGLGAAIAAGAAVAGALMIRPNLAPLGAVVLLLLWTRGARHARTWREWPWTHLLTFIAVAAIGPALVAWSQALLYGGAFEPGYIGWQSFFDRSHIKNNALMYPRHLIAVHTPLVLVGLAAPAVFRRRSGPLSANSDARLIVWSAMAVVALNYALYLPYISYDDLTYLRFMLPAITALCILLAGVAVQLARAIGVRSRLLAALALLPVIVVAVYPAQFVRYAFDLHREQARVRVMGHYLREVLPANAVVVTFLQAGAVAHYSGKQIVRLDLIESQALDTVLDDLTRHGYRPFFVVDELMEAPAFTARFAGSPYQRLDWPPRATLGSPSAMWYFDPADREAYRAGARWVTDTIP